MAKILKFFQTIRNNWKKSAVATAALSYGISYSKETYETEQLMRQCCENVMKYGDESCPVNTKLRHVTVILNPAAKKRKAKKLFEKYCEPLLHLAGIVVTVYQTESATEARNIVTNLNTSTDAIIVAGGDGTLCDVVTGLMRRHKHNLNSVKQCPIGVLPLGETSQFSRSLHRNREDLTKVQEIVEATMTIITGNYKLMDTIEIIPLTESAENKREPVYTTGRIAWGAWQDAYIRKDKYWYWGPLRKYATYVFNGYKKDLNWNCNGTLRYTDPCRGCSHCCKETTSSDQPAHSHKRWWHAYIPKRAIFNSENIVDYSKVINEECGIFHEIPISTVDLYIETSNIRTTESESKPSLQVQLGPKDIDYWTFISEGCRRENKNKALIDHKFNVKDIELYPEKKHEEQMLFIDNEAYELTPIKIKLLSQSIKMFYPN